MNPVAASIVDRPDAYRWSSDNRGVRRLEEAIARDPALQARVESLGALLRSSNTGIHD
jgi:hypothetical protein